MSEDTFHLDPDVATTAVTEPYQHGSNGALGLGHWAEGWFRDRLPLGADRARDHGLDDRAGMLVTSAHLPGVEVDASDLDRTIEEGVRYPRAARCSSWTPLVSESPAHPGG